MFIKLSKIVGIVSLLAISSFASAELIKASAVLDYAQEVTPSNSTPSNATGTAMVTFNTTTSTLDIMASVVGISLADITFPSGGLAFGTAGPFHIHTGIAGENGGVVVPFNLADFFIETPVGFDVIAMGIGFSADLITNLRAGGLYLNLHSLDYGSGEIRGQLAVVSAPSIAILALFATVLVLVRRK